MLTEVILVLLPTMKNYLGSDQQAAKIKQKKMNRTKPVVHVLKSSQWSQDLKAKILEKREMHRGDSDVPNCFSSLDTGFTKLSHTWIRC